MNIHQLQHQNLCRVVDQDSTGQTLLKLAQGLGQTLKTLFIGPQHHYLASFLCTTLLFVVFNGNVLSVTHQ